MDKKQGLISILEIVKDSSPRAKVFLDALKEDRMTPEMIDKLTEFMKTTISTLKDKETKNKFQEMINYLDKLKQKESIDRQNEAIELQNLEGIIDNI